MSDPAGKSMRFSETIVTNVPAAEAFEALADMAVLDTWNPNVTSSRRTTGDRLKVGSEYVSMIKRGVIHMRAESQLVECAPNRRVVYESNISGFHSIDSIDFERSESGTIVTFFNESMPPTWMRPLIPLLNAAFRPQARRAVEGARQALDRLEGELN